MKTNKTESVKEIKKTRQKRKDVTITKDRQREADQFVLLLKVSRLVGDSRSSDKTEFCLTIGCHQPVMKL